MNFWHDTSRTIWYGAYPIPNMTVYNLLVRYEASTSDKPDTFNLAERDMIREALRANGLAYPTAAAAPAPIDVAALADAIVKAGGTGQGATPEATAAAVTKALAAKLGA